MAVGEGGSLRAGDVLGEKRVVGSLCAIQSLRAASRGRESRRRAFPGPGLDRAFDACADAAWLLHCFDGIYRNVLSELAHVAQQVEEALGMDVSAGSFASEHMQEQLAFHIV